MWFSLIVCLNSLLFINRVSILGFCFVVTMWLTNRHLMVITSYFKFMITYPWSQGKEISKEKNKGSHFDFIPSSHILTFCYLSVCIFTFFNLLKIVVVFILLDLSFIPHAKDIRALHTMSILLQYSEFICVFTLLVSFIPPDVFLLHSLFRIEGVAFL